MTMLTVGEIAERIRDPGEPLAAVIERLRYWAKAGLLKPVGKRKPGTGHHRRYSRRAVLDAAILNKLHLHFGVEAPRLQHCDSALDLAAKHMSDFHLYDGQRFYLTIGVLYKDADATIPTAIYSLLQRVDVVRDRAAPDDRPGVPESYRPHLNVKLPDALEFGIVINLSSLYQRLAFPPEEAEQRERAERRWPEAARIRTAGFFSSIDLEDGDNG